MKTIKNLFWIALGLGIIIVVVRDISHSVINAKTLDDNHKMLTRAVIINERNYMGNSPVSHEFAYSYAFFIKGEVYKGNSEDSRLKVGDSINVEYAEGNPSLNRPSYSNGR